MIEPSNEPRYREWVLPNWSSFLPVLVIYPSLWLTFLPIDVAVGAWSGAILTLVVAALMFAKSARIVVTEEFLEVANATIERRFIGAVSAISKEDGFAERGRNLDPRAWIHFQGSVKTLLKVEISDPSDPTPYWLFSTRKPEELIRVLGF
jgi:hypothetical protein